MVFLGVLFELVGVVCWILIVLLEIYVVFLNVLIGRVVLELFVVVICSVLKDKYVVVCVKIV